MALFNAQSVGAQDRALEQKHNDLVTLLNRWATTVVTTADYTAADVLAKLITVDGAGSGLDADLLDARHASAFAWSESQTTADVNTIIQSGMYRMNLNTNRPTGTNYGQLLVVHGAGDTIFQVATDYASGKMYWRSGNPSDVGGTGAWGAWRLIWHDGNDGTGSGLDADLLDGNHSSAFLGATAQAADSDKLDGYHLHTGSAGPAWSTVPFIKSNGWIEAGLGIDFHLTASDTGDYDCELAPQSAGHLRIKNANGYIDLGPQNGTYCHIYSDITGGFYMNQKLYIASGDLVFAKSRFALGTGTTNSVANTSTTHNYGKTFSSTPIVMVSSSTSGATNPIVVYSRGTTSFVSRCASTSQTFDWLAVDVSTT